jgi:HrpA-like RNA helicase
MLNFTEIEETELYSIIRLLFPNLISKDTNLLFEYYKKLMSIICITFFKNNKKKLFIQLRFNDYQDGKALLLLLLPFIKDDPALRYDLKTLEDLYVKKIKEIDINEEEPNYKFCNIQYGRCNRDNNKATEIQFDKNHIEHNYRLLCETIYQCHNKMYVNWINIFPKKLKEQIKNQEDLLENKELEIKEEEQIKEEIDLNIFYEDINDDNIKYFEKALSKDIKIWDIYDTLTNDFYYGIKKIKWVLYNFSVSNNFVPYIIMLDIFFDGKIDFLKSWSSLDLKEQEFFIENWEIMKYNYINKNSVIRNFVYELNNFLNFMTVLITFLYNDLSIEKKTFNPLNIKNMNLNLVEKFNTFSDKYIDQQEQEDDEDILSYKKNLNEKQFNLLIKQILNSLKPTDIYEYLHNAIKKVKNSAYNIYFFNSQNKIYKFDKYNSNFIIQEILLIKILYNFSKSMCHINHNNKFIPLQRKWCSLDKETKEVILRRIYKYNYIAWFDITGNLKRLNIYDVKEKNKYLKNTISKHIEKIIKDCLITQGKLTDFEIIPELYEDKYETREDYIYFIQDTIKNYIKTKELDKNTYYYLNRELYSSPIYGYYDNDKLIENVDFFTATFNKTKVSDMWFSQYALNWVSQINFFHRYLNNSIIYVTGATGVGKSTQVPKLLLFSSIVYDNKYYTSIACTQPRINATSGNATRISGELACPVIHSPFVQYKYKGKYITSEEKCPSIILQTDGLLISEMYRNLLFTKTIETSKEIEFLNENIYDIVIVDEAHEHNPNMDMILTLMRYILNVNNKVKLVIISATMDADEPIYRRYYRCINDNLKSPLSVLNQQLKLDRINVDRRINIVAPGKTTKFKVNDIYLKDINFVKKNPDIQDMVKLVNFILKNSTKGDILIFQPGKAEIKECVELLNKNTPKQVMALPYYSELIDSKKEFVGKIDKQRYLLKMSKQDNFDDDKIDYSKGNNKYDRIIIVATNIAEASITISSLKYVIDTGTQRVSTYDFYRNCQSIKLTYISEQSRIQRRGRVGRVDSGSVFYLYNIEDIKNVKTSYNIANTPIHDKILSLLTNSQDLILTKEIDFMHIDNLDINKIQKKIASFLKNNFILNFYEDVEKKEMIEDYQYSYRGQENQYDYHNDINYLFDDYHYDGFTKDTIIDNTGSFYLIHPNETNIKRNILGHIIEHEIDSNKMQFIFSGLSSNMLIFNNKKSIIGTMKEILLNSFSSFKENENSIKLLDIYLYSQIFNCEEYILRIISILLTSNKYSKGVITEFKSEEKTMSIMPKLKNSSSFYSDLIYLLECINIIHKYIKLDLEELEKQIFIFYPEITEKIEKLDKDKEKKLYMYKKKNSNEYEDICLELLLRKYDNTIKKICNKFYLEFDFIKKYLKNYISIQVDLYCLANHNKYEKIKLKYEIKDVIKIIRNFKLDLQSINNNIFNKITSCLVLSFNTNIIYNISNTRYYLNMRPEAILKPLKIGTIRKYLDDRDTLLLDNKLSSYLLYFNINAQEDGLPSVTLLHKLDRKFLVYLSHLDYYYIKNMEKYLQEYEKLNKTEDKKIVKYISSIKKTVLELNKDKTKYFDLNMSNLIKEAL